MTRGPLGGRLARLRSPSRTPHRPSTRRPGDRPNRRGTSCERRRRRGWSAHDRPSRRWPRRPLQEIRVRRGARRAVLRCRHDARGWCRPPRRWLQTGHQLAPGGPTSPPALAERKAGNVTSNRTGNASAASSPALRRPWRCAARWPCERGGDARARAARSRSASPQCICSAARRPAGSIGRPAPADVRRSRTAIQDRTRRRDAC